MRRSATPTTRRPRLGATFAAGALAALAVLPALPADAEPEVIKAATVAPKGTPWSALMDRIKDRIERTTERHYRFKVYYGGRLGGEKETVRETRAGRIQLWGGSSAALATVVPELYALELPFLFESNEEADFVLDRYLRPEIDELLDARGFVLYELAENGWHGIGLKDRCVTGPESLQGVKLRSQAAKVYLDTFQAMGASPVEMAVPEVLAALQQGTVDGFSNTPLFSFATSWYRGIRYFTPTHHVYQPALVVYSKKWLSAQPPELRERLLAGVEEDQRFGRTQVRAIRQGLLDNFERAHIRVCEFGDEQRQALQRATAAVLKKYRRQAGASGRGLYAALDRGKAAFQKRATAR